MANTRHSVLAAIGLTIMAVVAYGCLVIANLAYGYSLAPIGLPLSPRRIAELLLVLGLLLAILAAALIWRTLRRARGARRWLPAAVHLAIVLTLVGLAAPGLAHWYAAYGVREVTWENDGAVLSGSVYLPRGPGPHPGIVLIHGTSPGLRSGYSFYADRFCRLGYAALIYDKRGCGRSTGELEFAALTDLAMDAITGRRLLQSLPGVDQDNVGYWGYSQGGALAPLAALHEDSAAFVVCLSGPGLSLGEQMLHCNQGRMFNATREEAGQAARLRQAVWDCYYDRSGYPELYAELQAVRETDWYKAGGFPPKLATPAEAAAMVGSPFGWMGAYMNHDPVPVLAALDCPLLMFYGTADTIVPPGESIRRITTAFGAPVALADVTAAPEFKEQGYGVIELREGAEIHVYAGAGHAFYGPEPVGVPRMPGLMPGYLADLEKWLTERRQ